MNVDMLTPGNPVTRKYLSIFYMFSIHQVIKEPKRITRTARTLIDHIVLDNPSNVSVTGTVARSIVSDHD